MKQELRKELECLFSWSEFYAKNQQWSSFEKILTQIDTFKLNHNIL